MFNQAPWSVIGSGGFLFYTAMAKAKKIKTLTAKEIKAKINNEYEYKGREKDWALLLKGVALLISDGFVGSVEEVKPLRPKIGRYYFNGVKRINEYKITAVLEEKEMATVFTHPTIKATYQIYHRFLEDFMIEELERLCCISILKHTAN